MRLPLASRAAARSAGTVTAPPPPLHTQHTPAPQAVGSGPGWVLGRAMVTDAATGRVTSIGTADVNPGQGAVTASANRRRRLLL